MGKITHYNTSIVPITAKFQVNIYTDQDPFDWYKPYPLQVTSKIPNKFVSDGHPYFHSTLSFLSTTQFLLLLLVANLHNQSNNSSTSTSFKLQTQKKISIINREIIKTNRTTISQIYQILDRYLHYSLWGKTTASNQGPDQTV